jgi:bifunctional UDP-N-acetylglucosamine pyrophosphorylase/glucosamine-1-phosphate N-acetyltransferase
MANEANSENITAIILAAGQGTRMRSDLPKVLHAAAGRPMIDRVVSELQKAGVQSCRVVVGFGAEKVKNHLKDFNDTEFYIQESQRGTADAVRSADVETLRGAVLICNGDHPLITSDDYEVTLNTFFETDCDILVVTSEVKNPHGFGRILRSQKGKLIGIVEERDATPSQKEICEINTGLYVIKSEILQKLLPQIKNSNAKKEFYLTDLISLGLSEGLKMEISLQRPRVARGVNTQNELAQASRALFLRKARALMESGVVIIDPRNTYIDSDVHIGVGTYVYPGVMITGKTKIGENCKIEAHCQIVSSQIGDSVEVRWGSILENAKVGKKCLVGPYARLRPDSVVGDESHIGNFVEIKKSTLGMRVKANHLSYIGDAEIGDDTNIGCGTITCNFAVDRKKYKTVIGKNVFVGSDSQFVAPVKIGDGAIIGSGSTITKDVPAKALAVARSRQFVKTDYNKGS